VDGIIYVGCMACGQSKPWKKGTDIGPGQQISIHRNGGIFTIHSCHHENPLTIRKQHMNSNITIIKTDGTVTANLLQHKKCMRTCTHTCEYQVKCQKRTLQAYNYTSVIKKLPDWLQSNSASVTRVPLLYDGRIQSPKSFALNFKIEVCVVQK